MIKRSSYLKRFLSVSVALLSITTLYLVWECRNIRFDYNFEHFFPVGSDDAEFYYQYRDKFEGDNDFLMIGLSSEKGFFNVETLTKLKQLNDKLFELEDIKSAYSISNLKTPIISSFGVIELPVVNLENPELLKNDSIQIFQGSLLPGNFISADGLHASIFLRTTEQIEKPAAEKLILHINELIAKSGFQNVKLTGKAKWELVYLEKTRSEMILFMGVSIILVIIFLWYTFRNVSGVIIPLIVVLLSIIWAIGIMTVTGKAIDIMIILMPCILFVVGMSDVIHITSQYYEKLQEGFEKEKAIRITLQEVGLATFLTSISTIVAFLTLNLTSIQPIRDFGTYTAVGVAAAYLFSITLLPYLLLITPAPSNKKIFQLHDIWEKRLRKLFILVIRNPKKIILISVIVTLTSIAGIGLIRVNNSVLDDLAEDDPVKQDIRFFNEHFSGVRGVELAIWPAKNDSELLTAPNLRELEMVVNQLQENFGLGAIVSPVELVKGFNQAIHDGEQAYFKLPENDSELESLLKRFETYRNQKAVRKYIDKEGFTGRITGRIKEKGSYAVDQKNADFINWLNEHKSGNIQYRITGSSDLIDKSNNNLTFNMVEGITVNILALMLIVGLLLRSWRLMWISAIPNVLPLLMIGGVMGYFGVDMRVSVSIIFSIAFGIAVDDTLHLLSRYKIERRKGLCPMFAMRRTYFSTGKAMIMTSLIIATGFSTLLLSNFTSTFLVGLLISLTLFFALIAELFLTPVLILYLRAKKKQEKNK